MKNKFKRLFAAFLSAAVALGSMTTVSFAAGKDIVINREALNRGLAAVKVSNGIYLSWRLQCEEDNVFGTSDSNVSFNIYRDGELIANEAKTTNYIDTKGTTASKYSVAPVINGTEGEKCVEVTAFKSGENYSNYFDIPLVNPGKETVTYTYPAEDGATSADFSFFPADCSCGDLDGDGEYEIVVKWTSSERDVGSPGSPEYSGTVRFAAYKLDGTRLWENDINLGKNVYSSAHTVQFLVYDFDMDGKAEITMQTAPGSKDATGRYVSEASADTSINSYRIQEINGKTVTVSMKDTKPALYAAKYNADGSLEKLQKLSYKSGTNEASADFEIDKAFIWDGVTPANVKAEIADYRGAGRVITGPEYLTVFEGETGKAIDTINLPTARGTAKGVDFGDDFGNRSNRFVADVAYLDGARPYAVYLRGYYFGRNGRQRTSVAGISFDGKRLSPDYRFDTKKGQPGYYEGAAQYVGNGNHNCTVADVDNDGKDEFITGALCLEVKEDNSFKPRWCTFMEHGDAMHIGDYDPTHDGYEFFTVHEDMGPNTESGEEVEIGYGMSVIDADTGEILLHETASEDTGRGVMANVGAGGYYQVWSAKNSPMQCDGGTNFSQIPGGMGRPSQNFRIFWDGDLYDELLDGTNVTSWNGNSFDKIFSANGCTKINGTKSNPGLQADLFGDWREELVYPTTDGKYLRVFTTTTKTDYKMKSLMYDSVYRSGVAAQQTAYNQPPHLGYFISNELFGGEVSGIEITSLPAKTVYALGEGLEVDGLGVKANYADGTSKNIVHAYEVSGYDAQKPGTQTVTVSFMNKTATFDVEVKDIDSIEITSAPAKTVYIPGEELDTTGLVVTAHFGEIAKAVEDYEVSGYNADKAGEQNITVTYMGKTAEFTVTVKELASIEIASPPSDSTMFAGASINTAGLVVNAVFTDGTKREITDYTLDYDKNTVGEQTVNVIFRNCVATFTITVEPSVVGALNNTYETDSTEPYLTEVPIGAYSGDFTLEHTVTVNSMPANASNNKNETTGFFMRFMPQKTGEKNGVGAGWQLSKFQDGFYVCWKSDGRNPIRITNSPIEEGKEYKFSYTFTNVGTGNGAMAALIVTDAQGNVIGSRRDLSLRNMTSSDIHKSLPLGYVEVHNQAESGKTASVTISGTVLNTK